MPKLSSCFLSVFTNDSLFYLFCVGILTKPVKIRSPTKSGYAYAQPLLCIIQ